ncbi:nucleosidase [Paenibacillus taichungensis]|uniref:Nucleosidase n=1 Tax=Paenibacillus taichungensis TaxID=484184 RepID=A0A329QZE0_9BACL|nr:HAD-IA family hydrolase [Paenibacillus taichungensis]RAW17159.1 nucleosidase [Paenibacillus taichungensis]
MISLIFDMDGTLFQTDRILETSLHNTFNHLRSKGLWEQDTPIEKYREIMGVPLPVVWKNLLPGYSDQIRQQANEWFHEKLIANIEAGHGALYPYVEGFFQYCKEKSIPIYIASNGQVEYLNAIVTYYHLDDWVTETFSIQQIASQNKSDLVRYIVEKYKITRGMVIGDRLSDIKAAKDNDLMSIGCNFDFAQADELAQAHRVIDSIEELKTLIGVL